jgi:DNA-binding transcriptional LysR family regulator
MVRLDGSRIGSRMCLTLEETVDLRRIDLNLLVVLDAIFEEENLTRVARRLAVSQPTVSASLAKLRILFGDDLFVRSQGAMRPTELALQFREPLRAVLEAIRFDIFARAPFDPKEEHGAFTISTTDFGELEFLPQIVNALAVEAPNLAMRTLLCDPDALPEAMDDGRIDLAYGYFTDLTSAVFHQQVIFDHDLVCIARRDHPRIGATLGRDRYLAEGHVVVEHGSKAFDVISETLDAVDLQRRIALAMSHSVFLPTIVAGTNLIATIPRPTALQAAKTHALTIYDAPFPFPRLKLKQVWHRRFDASPRLIWLRRLVARLVREAPGG